MRQPHRCRMVCVKGARSSASLDRLVAMRLVTFVCSKAYDLVHDTPDWNTIAAAVGDVAAYILIRTGDEKSWVTITYVPSGTKVHICTDTNGHIYTQARTTRAEQ